MNLQTIYQKHSNSTDYGDKGTAHSYIDTYSELFEPIREKVTNVLEIGCFYGHSLMMWREYFPNAFIESIEIIPELCFEEERIKVYHGDSTDSFLASTFKDTHYDIIIDDGFHQIDNQINTFNLYFPKLKKEGIYIIEDVLEANNPRFKELHNSYTLCDLSHERNIPDNKLVIYRK